MFTSREIQKETPEISDVKVFTPILSITMATIVPAATMAITISISFI